MKPNVQHNLKSRILMFTLTSPEPRAWLVLKGDDKEARVVPMQQSGMNAWSVHVDLIAGEYRCRYYCGDDRMVIYYGPAHIEGGIDSGMDTLVSVRIPEEKEAEQLSQCWTGTADLFIPQIPLDLHHRDEAAG